MDIKIIHNEFQDTNLVKIIISPAKLIVRGHEIFLADIKNHIKVIEGMNRNIHY